MGIAIQQGVFTAATGLAGAGATVIWLDQWWIGAFLITIAALLVVWGLRWADGSHVWTPLTRALSSHVGWRFKLRNPSMRLAAITETVPQQQLGSDIEQEIKIDPLSLAIAKERHLKEQQEKLASMLKLIKGQWHGLVNIAKLADDATWGMRRKGWRPLDYRWLMKDYGYEIEEAKVGDPRPLSAVKLEVAPERVDDLLWDYWEYVALSNGTKQALSDVELEIAPTEEIIRTYGNGTADR